MNSQPPGPFSYRGMVLSLIALAAAMAIGFWLPEVAQAVDRLTGADQSIPASATPTPWAPVALTFTPVPPTKTPTTAPPSPTFTPTLTPTPRPTDTPAPTHTPKPTGTPVTTHKVQPGESLRDIAERYGVSVEGLIKLNNIQDADHISVGDELKLPR